MKIVADENIPRVRQAFRGLGEVVLLPGRDIRRQHLLDCQCLVVRTVTAIDANLLQGTPVEFVGTATIGTDHVDLEYLKNNHIAFSNAAGCNAEAASEYVISGLFALSKRKDFDPFTMKAGIVGFGNVGSRLHQKLTALGIECLVNDPPLQQSGQSRQAFVDLDTILQECDFISLHVPLTRSGEFSTYHLLDARQMEKLAKGCLLVNAARGEVVDNLALLNLLRQGQELHVFLDTWENEPLISRELLQQVDLATPHIAGYSLEGRLRGTQMILDAACDYFAKKVAWHMAQAMPEFIAVAVPSNVPKLEFWQTLFQSHCDIWRDHEALKDGTLFDNDAFPRHFDSLRRVYLDRLEYERFILSGDMNKKTAAIARRLLFRL